MDRQMPQGLQAESRSPHDLEQAELALSLSRRHALPFGVVGLRIVGLERRPPESAIRPPLRDQSSELQLEATLRDELRRTDLIARSDRPGRYLLFCPSTPAEGLKEVSERIRRLGGPGWIQAGTASFRDDGFTLHDLIGTAWERAELTTSPDAENAGAIGAEVRLWPMQLHRVSQRRRRWNLRIKRIFDIGFVVALAPIWLPVAAGIAVAVKLTAPLRPVLFIQKRTGLGGRPFQMVKFRTMVVNAEEIKSELRHLSQRQWPDFKIERDPRVTRLGRILRKTSLDELPQLWNVLRGEMSLVGPRPTSFTPDTYAAWHTARLEVPPGMTGLWQIKERGSSEFDERLRLDLEYIERQSFLYDLGILFRTIRTVFRMSGGH
jgi:lipopolysaccharide/colanic/teichoic acid biosynthesis glycosyltransferase